MKRKSIWIMVSLLVVLGLLLGVFGCAKKEVTAPPKPAPTTAAPSPVPSPAPSPAPTPKPTAPTPAQPQVIKWKAQKLGAAQGKLGPWPEQNFQEDAYVDWVKAATGGRLIIEQFQPSSLYPPTETFNALNQGIADIVVRNFPGYYAGAFPESAVATGIPFNADNTDEVYTQVHMYGLMDTLKEAYAEKGVLLISVYPSGPQVIHTSFDISTLAAFKGKKIRAAGTDGLIIQAMGASPVNVPVPEMIQAMKLGTIDGLTGVKANLSAGNYQEVIKYSMFSPFKIYVNDTIVSQKSFNALPEDIKQILMAGSDDNQWAIQYSYRALEQYIVANATKVSPTKIVYWSEADVKAARALAIEKVWPDMAKASPRNAKMIEAIKKFNADFNK